VQSSGDELKLIYPQPGAESGTESQPRAESQPGLDPADFELLCFRHFFLQPMDGPNRAANTELALRYCLAHPKWRLSLQTHKILGIP
jgi:organic radical activating enzyme